MIYPPQPINNINPSIILKHPIIVKIILSLSILFTALFLLQKDKPTIYIIGDSTVRNTNRPQCGWGEMIGEYFDTEKISISNQAMAGRSTRTFIKEGRWDKVMGTIKKGDYLIMQFGHNEGSKPDTSRGGRRGVLKGTGDEAVELTWPDGTKEIVNTYGWYLKKFVKEAKAKGAIPIIVSMIPRNEFKEGKVKRADNDFGKWAKEVAEKEGAFFIDLNGITANKYDALGPDEVKKFFPGDHTHTNVDGARVNAASVAEGIRLIKNLELNKYLISKK
ncbi:MAG: rhamnogalacturonan acetylesterase [Ferruginibacter sp.]|nr:rhamnogalacturonan acetylesterase [Ferruginibacter sp.]